MTDGGQPSPLDRIFEALSVERNRYILYSLLEDESIEFDTLVDRMVSWETGGPAADAPDDVQKEIRRSLYHAHLPKLANLDIIEYDERSGSIRYRNPLPRFEEICNLARDLETA